MTTIITTTGKSLYLNTIREYKVAPTEKPTENQMREFLRKNPERASAEVNSLLKIAKSGDTLVFLCTDEKDIEVCVNQLKVFFINEQDFQPYQIVIKKLQFQDNEDHMETQGMRNLINTIIDEIDKAHKNDQDVIINATAGFKAQIAYSTIIGMTYQVPVKYIHELFKKIVTLEPLEIYFDTTSFFTYRNFFQWIEDDFRTEQDVDKEIQSIAYSDRDKVKKLLTQPDKDGHIFINPMGNVSYRKFQSDMEAAKQIPWPPDAQETNPYKKINQSIMDGKHHPIKNIKKLCEKIASQLWVMSTTGSNYENTTLSRVKNWSENGTISVLWADNEKAQNLEIITTARGYAQTQKVANVIKEIVEQMS